MNIVRVIEYLYPEARVLQDFTVADEGKGQYIAEWNLPDPKPSKADLLALEADPDFQAWLKAKKNARIDRDTGKAINEAIHPFAGVEEQIGRNRAQIAAILNAIGLEPLPEFDEFNTIVAEKIAEGRAKKEELNAEDN